MSISSLCEVTCDCGEIFEAELWIAVSVSENPELREAILAGEFNLVSCPKCGQMFYWEQFFIYQDIKNEFIAYVYPKYREQEASKYRNQMFSEFKEALISMPSEAKIDYDPTLYFGIEDLTATLKTDDYINDEIKIFEFICQRIGLDIIKIKPSAARKFCIIEKIPKIKQSTDNLCKDIITGLEILLKYNPNLIEYEKLLVRIKKNGLFITELTKNLRAKK